jgi:putative membrane protein
MTDTPNVRRAHHRTAATRWQAFIGVKVAACGTSGATARCQSAKAGAPMTNPSKTDLAEDRTDLAEDRTALASERTFAGWMRTGFAAVGIALGFHALFNAMTPSWVPRSISTAFLLIAVFVFVAAGRQAERVQRRLATHRVETAARARISLIVGGATASTLALALAIWALPITP